jgi:hypothetical protein
MVYRAAPRRASDRAVPLPVRSLGDMPTLPTAPVVATGLIGGFAAGRFSGRRELGGAVLAAAGAWSARRWLRSSGPGVMGLLLGTYTAAFGVSHPLAKKLGAWPAVLTVAAVASGASYALGDRSAARF